MKLTSFYISIIAGSTAVLGFSPAGYVQKFGVTKALFSADEDDIETVERALYDAEQAKRKDDAQMGLNEQEKSQFNAKKNDYDSMRARLRDRAGNMDMSQSLETEQVGLFTILCE